MHVYFLFFFFSTRFDLKTNGVPGSKNHPCYCTLDHEWFLWPLWTMPICNRSSTISPLLLWFTNSIIEGWEEWKLRLSANSGNPMCVRENAMRLTNAVIPVGFCSSLSPRWTLRVRFSFFCINSKKSLILRARWFDFVYTRHTRVSIFESIFWCGDCRAGTLLIKERGNNLILFLKARPVFFSQVLCRPLSFGIFCCRFKIEVLQVLVRHWRRRLVSCAYWW